MNEVAHILVVDDDVRLRDLLKKFLTEHGFLATAAPDAKTARNLLESIRFDCMVLDVMMPGETGIELARSLNTRDTPVLLLSALGEPQHRIDGLEAGVQDYLVKPFEPRELILRIRNILKMQSYVNPASPKIIHFGPYQFDMEKQQLLLGETVVALTTAEELLLKALLERLGNAITREELSRLTSTAENPTNERSVDVQINRLRKKIDLGDKSPSLIRTVRGAGYVIYP